MISFENLDKHFGSFQAVRKLNLKVRSGEMFGFLGPNGAGNTTTIRMAMGILVPTSGKVLINSLESATQRASIMKNVGYLPDDPIFYEYMKGSEVLQFVGEMHGQAVDEASDNANRLLEEFALVDAAQEYAVNYSMGMKKKLGLACALIHNPKILFLDEPTNGLDPRASHDMQQRLVRFADDGGTVFLSSHLLNIAERLCDRFGIIHRGELIAQGTLAEMNDQIRSDGGIEELYLKITDEPNHSRTKLL